MTIISREQWGARGPNAVTRAPVNRGVAVHWEGPHMGAFGHDRCAALVRGIQRFHMDTRKWADIAYNALVCPHGDVFIGRGRGVRNAASGTNDANGNWAAVCYLGGQGDPFTIEARRGFNDAARALGAGGDWRPHSSFQATECPGDELRAWVAGGHADHGIPTQPQEPPRGDHPPFPGLVRRGSRGDAVRAVQQRLADRGWRITVDGDFGPQTDRIVRQFQAEKGLDVDGIVGPITWGALWTAPVT